MSVSGGRRGWRSVRRTLAVAAAAGSLIAGSPYVARTQAVAAPTLRLDELYAAVERSSPRIAAAGALARAADARVPGAYRPPDPQVQLGLMNRLLPGLGPMPTLGMSQLQVMQMVPVAGKLSLAGAAERSRANAAAARAADVHWELRSQAAMAFYELYATDRGLDVARETLRLLHDIAQTAEAMYRVGEGRQADVLRAQVEIARMAEDTLRMQAMREGIAARLDAMLDRPSETPVASPRLPSFPTGIPSRPWLDSVALTGRPMLHAGTEDVRAAESNERLARRDIIPDVQVGLQLGQQGSQMGTDRMVSLMLGASIPVFAHDRQIAMRDEANAMRLMAEADLASMRADTRGRIGAAYAELMRARRLAALYRGTILPQAEAAAQSALASYRVGAVNLMTLLDDRMIVNRYRQDLFTLEADEGKAWGELEMLTGRELFDSNAAPRGPQGKE